MVCELPNGARRAFGHCRAANRAAITTKPNRARVLVEDHVTHRVWCGWTEVGTREELRCARIEPNEAIRLRSGFNKPESIIVVHRHSVR